MTFHWLNNQGVRSDSGFEFQFTGRFSAEYRENNRVTSMYVEGGAGTLTIYEGSLEGLLSGIENSSERKIEQNRLIKNLHEALAFQNLKLDLASGQAPSQ